MAYFAVLTLPYHHASSSPPADTSPPLIQSYFISSHLVSFMSSRLHYSHLISNTLITVHALLGWDRPVYGKIAAMQLLKIKDMYEKVRDSPLLPLRPAWADCYSSSSVYDKYIPQVLEFLSKALMVESEDEGQPCVCVCVHVIVLGRKYLSINLFVHLYKRASYLSQLLLFSSLRPHSCVLAGHTT